VIHIRGLKGHLRGFRLLQSRNAREPNFPREPAEFSGVVIRLWAAEF